MGRTRKQPVTKVTTSNNSKSPSATSKGRSVTKNKETVNVKPTQVKTVTTAPEVPKSLIQEAEKSPAAMETVKKPTGDSTGNRETTPLVATVLESVKSPLFIMDDSEGESSQKTAHEGEPRKEHEDTKPSSEPELRTKASGGDKEKQITNIFAGNPLTEKCNCDLCIIDRMNIIRQQSAKRAAERGNTDRIYDPRDLTFVPYPPYIHGISDFNCTKLGRDVDALKAKLASTKENTNNKKSLPSDQKQGRETEPTKVVMTATPSRSLTRSNSSATQVPKTVQAALKKASESMVVGKPGDRSSTCPPGTPRSATFRGNRVVSTPSTLGLSTRALNLRAQRFAHRAQAAGIAQVTPNTPVGASDLGGNDIPRPSDTPMPDNSSFWVQGSPAPLPLAHLRATAPRPFPLAQTVTNVAPPMQSGPLVAPSSGTMAAAFTAINLVPRSAIGTPTPVNSNNGGTNIGGASSPRVSRIPRASPVRPVSAVSVTPAPTRAQNTLAGMSMNANTSAQRQGGHATLTTGNIRNGNRQHVGRPLGSRTLGELNTSAIQNTGTPGVPPASSPKRARTAEQVDSNGSPTKKSRVAAEEKDKENRSPNPVDKIQAVSQKPASNNFFGPNKENAAPAILKTRAEAIRAQAESILSKPNASPASRVHGMALQAEADDITSLALQVPPPAYKDVGGVFPATPVAHDNTGNFRMDLAMEERKCLSLIQHIDNKMKQHKSGLEQGAFIMNLLQTKLMVVRRAAAGSPGEGMDIGEDW